MNTTADAQRSLEAAARTIYYAATGGTPADPVAVATAHTTLTRELSIPPLGGHLV